jgi:hypothetical protein
MKTYSIHLHPSTAQKLENIAEKLDLSLQETLVKAMHFYAYHHLRSAHQQSIYVVFDQQNHFFDLLIDDFQNSIGLESYGQP